MRYEDLDLPIGDSTLGLRFNPRLTVLAGLTGTQRNQLIAAVGDLTAGTVPGGRIGVVDSHGRHGTLGCDTPPDPLIRAPGNARHWSGLLAVSAEDLGLPCASDDPARLSMQRELQTARARAEALRAELQRAEETERHHAAMRAELDGYDTRLAHNGTAADRHQHDRTRALVRLEQLHASLGALDAPRAQQDRDARLLEETTGISRLAAEWAELGERLDHLRMRSATHHDIDPDRLSELVDVPGSIAEPVIAAVAARDLLLAERADQKAELQRRLSSEPTRVPTDSRVLTLSTLDQETLWMTHRDVILATEALQAAQREAHAGTAADPAEKEHLEHLHRAAGEAAATAERRWLPAVLTATVSACSAALLLITEVGVALTPLLLMLCVGALAAGVFIPRVRVRTARQNETAALEAVGVSDIAQYRARLDDDPTSARWRRADRIIDGYEQAMANWQALVGDISPHDATLLESQITEWVANNDPSRHQGTISTIRRSIERTTNELGRVNRELATMLAPYKLDPHTDALADALTERVAQGRAARLQSELADTEKAEAELTERLERDLVALGFEAGDLTERIGAFGRELDAANRRHRLRVAAPDRARLEEECRRVEAELARPLPPQVTDESDEEDPELAELRRTRDALHAEVAALSAPDTGPLRRDLNRLENRIGHLESDLFDDRSQLVDRPVDHLVATLVRYRPCWPGTEDEPLPAILNDPFTGAEPSLKRQLLDALIEVSGLVQVILLTGDHDVVTWARTCTGKRHLTLVTPDGAAPR